MRAERAEENCQRGLNQFRLHDLRAVFFGERRQNFLRVITPTNAFLHCLRGNKFSRRLNFNRAVKQIRINANIAVFVRFADINRFRFDAFGVELLLHNRQFGFGGNNLVVKDVFKLILISFVERGKRLLHAGFQVLNFVRRQVRFFKFLILLDDFNCAVLIIIDKLIRQRDSFGIFFEVRQQTFRRPLHLTELRGKFAVGQISACLFEKIKILRRLVEVFLQILSAFRLKFFQVKLRRAIFFPVPKSFTAENHASSHQNHNQIV